MSYKKAQTAKLRALLRGEGLVVGAGAYDGLTARIVEKAGFDVCFVTGAGVSMSHGYADAGLLCVEEVVSTCRYIAEAVRVPVIVDMDNGYGNAMSVWRAIRLFEQAGVAGIHFEDQAWPKRCGHLAGKRLVTKEEMVQKIHAALDAREDPDFLIMARCDAVAVSGLKDALDRAEAYVAAGTDMLWFEMRNDMQEIEAMARQFKARVPLHFNHSSSGKVPRLSLTEIEKLGFKTVGYHAHAANAMAKTAFEILTEIRKTGNTTAIWDRIGNFEEFYNICGLQEIQAMEKKYGV
jgi:2-methylisocitrate lyase-like PEP mutase family enzyme